MGDIFIVIKTTELYGALVRPYLEYVDGYQPVSTNPKVHYNAGHWRSPSLVRREAAAAGPTFPEMVLVRADLIIIISPPTFDCDYDL